jgi:hypothetical protein
MSEVLEAIRHTQTAKPAEPELPPRPWYIDEYERGCVVRDVTGAKITTFRGPCALACARLFVNAPVVKRQRDALVRDFDLLHRVA